MSAPTGAAEAAKALERRGWGARAHRYGLLTGRITARVVDPLLDAAGVEDGTRVLDVGTGPGYAAAAAAGRGAIATGVDIADELVALARRQHRGIRFRQGDAEELPFSARSFDAVVCNFAINHLPEPDRAMREFTRVVTPGGRVAVSVWDLPERNRFLGIIVDALDLVGASVPRESVPGPDPYRFADDEELGALLRGAGVERVRVRSVSLTERVADAGELWEGVLGGSVRTAGLVMSQPPPVRARVRAAVERLAEDYRADGALAIPVRAKIAWGGAA